MVLGGQPLGRVGHRQFLASLFLLPKTQALLADQLDKPISPSANPPNSRFAEYCRAGAMTSGRGRNGRYWGRISSLRWGCVGQTGAPLHRDPPLIYLPSRLFLFRLSAYIAQTPTLL